MKRYIMTVCILLISVTFVFAGSHKEVTYKDDIRPLMESQCFMCHGDDAPSLEEFDADKEKYENRNIGPRMTTYEEVKVFVTGDDAGAIMRRLDDGSNTADGNPGNMYEYLGRTDEDRQQSLSVFKEWVGYWTLKRSDELTDEDIEKFSIPE